MGIMPRGTTSNRLEQFRKLSALHVQYLKYVGLWTLDSDSPVLSRCLYHVYNKLVITVMFVFTVTVLADICLSLDDISIVTDDGCIFAGIFVILFKVLTFQARRGQIARLLRATIRSCDQLCKFTTGGEHVILDRYLLFCRASLYVFGTLAFVLVIALLFLVPVEDGDLPIRARYPFNTSAQPWHGIGFFVEACSISVGLTAIIGMDSVQMNICVLFLVQFQILNEHFENCDGRDERSSVIDDYKVAGDRGGFVERFGRSVRDHQRLLAVIDDFNEVFSAAMFVQMLSSTTMICLTGFQIALVTGRRSSSAYKFSIYLTAAVSQLFYICWIGNEVMHQSASLTQSQWLSGWDDELSNGKTGRLLVLSMIFSKRTLNLKAGVFYVLSMETFTTIMRGSYSFFALLSTMQPEADQ